MLTIFFSSIFFISFSSSICYYFEDNRPRYLTAGVGDSVVFDCEIDFPQDFPIPYKLYWKRKVILELITYLYYSKLIDRISFEIINSKC